MIKKMALGFVVASSMGLPFCAISCSNIDKTFTVNFNGAESLEQFKDRLEDLVSKLSDVDSKGYKVVNWVVVDGQRKFSYVASVNEDENAQFSDFSSKLEAFMDVSLKARGYLKGYPTFMAEYNV